MKFKVIETETEAERERERERESSIKTQVDTANFSRPFINLFDTDSNSSTDTLTRLQSLADSLPTQIYDRHGNLIPLNTSQPPISFFEIESIKAQNQQQQQQQQLQTKTVPIFHRENVDWSQVSITSILKKIVPEEAFLIAEDSTVSDVKAEEDTSDSLVSNEPSTTTNSNNSNIVNTSFSQIELRLLDKDQLHSLAKNLKVSCEQTDPKIEAEILSNQNIEMKRNSVKKVNEKDLEKICWTEENENLLVKLYEELRIEKQKVDQKLNSLLNLNLTCSNNTASLRRGNGASERGIWAVLADQMRLASKSRASVSECRKKLIILKRLKP
jgi:hypothetical protein